MMWALPPSGLALRSFVPFALSTPTIYPYARIIGVRK